MLNVKIGLSYKNNQKEILPPDIYILFMQNSDIVLYFPALLLNIKKKKNNSQHFWVWYPKSLNRLKWNVIMEWTLQWNKHAF